MDKFWNSFRRSVVDFGFYKEVALVKPAKSVKYLVLLMVLTTVVLSFRFGADLVQSLNGVADWTIQNVPEFTITNGQVSSDVEQPYIVQDGNFSFVIDTTGEVSSLDSPRGMLITENKFIYKESKFQSREYDLSNIALFVFNEELIERRRGLAIGLSILVMVIGLFLYSLAAKLLQVFCYSFVSLIANKASGANLGYSSLFNIGVFALTPVVILGIIVNLVGIPLPFFWLLYSGVYIVYLVRAMMSCKLKPGLTENVGGVGDRS